MTRSIACHVMVLSWALRKFRASRVKGRRTEKQRSGKVKYRRGPGIGMRAGIASILDERSYSHAPTDMVGGGEIGRRFLMLVIAKPNTTGKEEKPQVRRFSYFWSRVRA